MRSSSRGQVLVIFSLTLILVVLMICMTVALGLRTREKLEQQTLADMAAYSNGIATARTYNTLSMLNRTAVSHWVALLGVQANHAWGSLHKPIFGALASGVREFEDLSPGKAIAAGCSPPYQRPGADGMGGTTWDACPELYDSSVSSCPAKSQQLKAASYSSWHGALHTYRGQNGGGGGDKVWTNCDGSSSPNGCTAPLDRPSWGQSFGKLDRDVARQARDVHESILFLTDIQNDVRNRFQEVVVNQRLTERMLRIAAGNDPDNGDTGAFRVVPTNRAWKEARDALGSDPRDMESIAHAAMGTRALFMMNGADQEDEAEYERVVPDFTVKLIERIQNELNGRFGNRFEFKLVRPQLKVRTYLARDPGDYYGNSWTIQGGMAKTGEKFEFGFGNATASAHAELVIKYTSPCGGDFETIKNPKSMSRLAGKGESLHEFGHGTIGEGLTAAHNAAYGNTCHAGHRHWGEQNENIHRLSGIGPNANTLWPGGVGFVFPQSVNDGAGSVLFGQPKLVTMVTRRYGGPGVPKSPWDLAYTFRLGDSGDEGRFAIGGGEVPVRQAVFGTSIVYYHRRRLFDSARPGAGTGWKESPNLLNPYWRTTLVRSDVDERSGALARRPQTGNSPPSGAEVPATQRDAYQMLNGEGLDEAADAYQRLNAKGFDAWQ